MATEPNFESAAQRALDPEHDLTTNSRYTPEAARAILGAGVRVDLALHAWDMCFPRMNHDRAATERTALDFLNVRLP